MAEALEAALSAHLLIERQQAVQRIAASATSPSTGGTDGSAPTPDGMADAEAAVSRLLLHEDHAARWEVRTRRGASRQTLLGLRFPATPPTPANSPHVCVLFFRHRRRRSTARSSPRRP